MSGRPVDPVTIPARVTVERLAEAVGREMSEIQAVLNARGEPSAPNDIVDHALAADVARALGAEVRVETRDLALEYLYESETRGEMSEPPEGRVSALVVGISGQIDELDRKIEAASEHWSVARMPTVDRNILRLGLYELEHHPQTSTAVILSEAVRLAQTYSTEKSGAFVNGVLAALAKEVADR
ncbi:MAG: transcription antitermination factor NusB [Actinomycetota bacterium]|nr:transcription antitermination factor NusB [Actinomycetota bacterium]